MQCLVIMDRVIAALNRRLFTFPLYAETGISCGNDENINLQMFWITVSTGHYQDICAGSALFSDIGYQSKFSVTASAKYMFK